MLGGGDFKFQDDGTHILSIVNSSSDVIIKPIVDIKILYSNKEMVMKLHELEITATLLLLMI